MHLKEFDSRKFALTNIINNYLENPDIDVDDRLFNFKKSIKNLSDINKGIQMIIDNYKSKTETEYED